MMTEQPALRFADEIDDLGQMIAEMGGIAEKMLTDAMEALSARNSDLARRTIAADPDVDRLQRAIEEQAVAVIARRQPAAEDLRELVGVMRIAGDLERIGDLAKNIARRAIGIAGEARGSRILVGVRQMGRLAALQLKTVLDAYATRDPASAVRVWRKDAEIDAIEEATFRDLLTFMMEDPRSISYCTHLLFCSKNIERIGDHATNIAETVHYIAAGASLPIERPKSLENNGAVTVLS